MTNCSSGISTCLVSRLGHQVRPIFTACAGRKKEKKRKTSQAAKSSHQLRKRGHLRRKAPSPEKKKAVSGDQEGCGQTSQQTSPDWFEGEENAQGNVWSERAYEHSAQNEHGA